MPETKKGKPKASTIVVRQPQIKELYLARNLTHLNSQVDDKMTQLKTAGFNNLCRSADKLWETLNPNEQGTQDEDQERAYVLLLRYVRILRLIEKNAGDKKFVFARFGSRLENAVNRWEHLRQNLGKRYAGDPSTSGPSPHMATDTLSMEAIVAKSLEKLKDKPPVSAEMQFMTKYLCDAKSTDPKCLFLLLQDKVNILLVDIRPKAAFESSRIKCDAHLINIDGDIIRKGMSTNKLSKMLPADTHAIFENRKKYELVIVIDENSFPMSHIHSMGDHTIYTFLDIMNNWDLDSGRYPNGGPVMLQGGFAGWIDHYPAMCVNPQSRFQPGNAPEYLETFLNFEYPTFNYDPVEKKVLVIDRSTKPIYPMLAKTATQVGLVTPEVAESAEIDDDFATLRHESDIESDIEEAAYKNVDLFDAKLLRPIGADPNDVDAMRKGLAYLAVSVRMAANRRLMCMRKLVAFSAKYDVMTVAQREPTGDQQLKAALEALDEAQGQVTTLTKQRNDYVAQFPYLAESGYVTYLPHGPITARADEVVKVLQTRFFHMKSKHIDCLEQARNTVSNIKEREEVISIDSASGSSIQSTQTMSNNSIPPRLSIPKIPDRTFQPAAIWLPNVISIADTVTGLVNYHNNCFLNATVQALRHVPTFYKYILNRDYKHDMKHSNKSLKPHLLPQLVKVVEDLWKSHDKMISAERLYKTMLETCPIFEDWRHEDGLEVFTLVFNRICEETERPMHIQAQYDFYRSDKIEHWIRMHNRQISFLAQRFYYEIKRTRDCKMCNRKMITYDISNSMMLPLKLPNETGGMYTPSRLNLQDAVTAYMETPDRYKILCTKCKRMAIEYKKIKYYPEVAVINLKRYVNTGTSNSVSGILRSDTYVSFPEKNLKIGIAHYRLNAVVCHTGTMESGHYTALCFNQVDKNWYYYDDGSVTQWNDIHDEGFRRKCYVFYYSLETEFQRLNLNYVKL